MNWARRLAIGAGLAGGMAVALMTIVPGIAGATDPSCPTTTAATVTPSMTPSTTCPVQVPTVAASSTQLVPASPGTTAASSTSGSTAGSSSLPFTGADVEELAVIGGIAVLAGALLMRRRRTAGV